MQNTIKSLLVCPVTKQHLFPPGHDKAAILLKALSEGGLHYMDGSKLKAKPNTIQFLMTENKQHVYSLVDGVPILIESKQIDLSQLQINETN